MDFGVYILPTSDAIDPARLGVELEDRGFESVFFPEHTHIPAGRETPYPYAEELADEYSRTMDPFVVLGSVATHTTSLRIGTGICLVAQRDPIVLAKAVATVDQLSAGRFLFGVGAGWNREEIRNHGVDPAERMAVVEDRLAAMRAIWTQPEASHHGEHVSFERIWSWPKPVQQPHPPVLVAGDGPTVLDRVLDYGDGWFPPDPRDHDLLRDRVRDLRIRAEERGRARPSVSIFAARPHPEDVEQYAEMGVDRCVFWLPSAGPEKILPRLDRYHAVMIHHAAA